jgi:hypothetical protein
MLYDTMKQISKISPDRVSELGKILGLSQKEIEKIIQRSPMPYEQTSLSTGPGYRGSYYGTVSINDFY